MPDRRITLDYTAGSAERSGSGRYARQLVSALDALHSPHRYTLFSRARPNANPRLSTEDAFRLRALPLGDRFLTMIWQQARLPLPADLFTGRADLWHGLDFTLPPLLHGSAIVTIPDLTFLAQPDGIEPSRAASRSRAVSQAVQRADAIITFSQQVRHELVERLSAPAERVQVIYPGVSAAFQRITDSMLLAATRHKFELQTPFILTVGTLEPRKNLVRLIQAFDKIRRDRSGPRMLAIAGQNGWRYEEVYEIVNRLSLKNEVRFLGHVTDLELVLLYSLADVVALPSLYAGFGFTVLEAMACGAPVVCSNAGALPEVAGDAALLVNPTDTDALGTMLSRLLRNPRLRALLSKKGQARAAKFTWDACAQNHLKLYEEVIQKREEQQERKTNE
ncbi:MAG TPA: glycosyltransferase family 1 protein [Ktedonobacterales bacterium]|jgi:glycosyltransferase involved in cell wall biosynthesis